jgi:N-acyl homoserine lactone hydrolase
MPAEERTTGTAQSRAMIEAFLKEKQAQIWIGHSIDFFRNAWYE